jgi:ribosomal protein S18 acetylase RimI-like enzyme
VAAVARNPLQIGDDSGNALSLAPWQIGDPTDPMVVAGAQNTVGGVDALGAWLAEQRVKSAQAGLWNDQTGMPTHEGVASAGRQYLDALMASTSASGGRSALPAAKSIDDVSQAWDGLGINHALSENNGTITLSKIIVPPDTRNQGVGSQALQHLADYADATGQRIVLTPTKDFGATSISRLTDFYKGLGFKPNKGRSRDFTTREGMIRDPRETDTGE